jgi:hypothetical protein
VKRFHRYIGNRRRVADPGPFVVMRRFRTSGARSNSDDKARMLLTVPRTVLAVLVMLKLDEIDRLEDLAVGTGVEHR